MSRSAYLNSLPEGTPQEKKDKKWQACFYYSMPNSLQELVDKAANIDTAEIGTIRRAIGLIDYTSLKESDSPMKGSESSEDVRKICKEASGDKRLSTAAVCFYPNHIETAKKELQGTGVQIAVVNNFPHGDMSAEQAAEDIGMAAAQGADEIDTVIDYVAWHNGDRKAAQKKFQAAGQACKEKGVKLKDILKASTHSHYQSLYDAAYMACETGADFVKTCTGKVPKNGYGTGAPDVSTLLTMATVMRAVSDYNRAQDSDVGVKISGGIKTPVDCERMRYLVEAIMGPDYYDPKTMRIGASSLRKNLDSGAQNGHKELVPSPDGY